MKKFYRYPVKDYLDALASREPVPGGGSAAAAAAALGAALISMVANYSLKKGKPASVEKKIAAHLRKSEKIREKLTELLHRDAESYLNVVKTRKGTAAQKRRARTQAQKVPQEIARECYKAIELTPFLVKEGNPNLLSDIEVAVELLYAAFESAQINVRVNQ